MYRLGLDIGGTKIAAAVYSPAGVQVYYQRYETEKQSYNAFIVQIKQIVACAANQIPERFSIGIGLPGAICPNSDKIKNSNILILNGNALKEDLSRELGQPVWLANDADCFALSEAINGAGQDFHSCFGAILGTGCGGGVVYNKHLVKGPNNVAGEWGHNPLADYHPVTDGTPEPCYCGRNVCNESFLSGTGFAKGYNQKHQTALSSKDIMDLANHDQSAQAHYELYLDQLARALAQVINFFDPAVIVLGGGMSNQQSLYDDLPSRLGQYVFGGVCNTPIRQAKLGDDSGVLGAALLPV